MENNKDIGKAFREKLDQLDKMPSDQLWSAIEKDLPTHKRRKIPFFWIFSSVSLMSLVMGGLFFWNPSAVDATSTPKITLEPNYNSVEHLNKNIENPKPDHSTNQSVSSKNFDTKNNSVEALDKNIENPKPDHITNQSVSSKTLDTKNNSVEALDKNIENPRPDRSTNGSVGSKNLDTKNNSVEALDKNIENPKPDRSTNGSVSSKNLATKNNSAQALHKNIENSALGNKTTNQTVSSKTNQKKIATMKHTDEIYQVGLDSVKKSSPKTKIAANQKGQNTTTSKSTEIELQQGKLDKQQHSNAKKAISSTINPSNSKVNTSRTHKKTVNTSETEKLVNNTKRLVKSTEEYDEYEVVKKYTYIVKKKKIVESGNPNSKSKKVIPNKKSKASSKKRFTTKKKTSPKKSPIISKNVEVEAKIPPTQNATPDPENKEELIIKKDTTAIPITEKKPKVMAKKDIKKALDSIPTVKEKKQSIIITPYYGPTYYNSFGKGNSISGNYRNDPKKGLIGATYGAYIRWMFSDRVGLRIGIGKTKLSYATTIQKKDTLSLDTRNINLNPNLITFNIGKQFANDPEVVLRQNLEYYEMPLEAYYDFSDKKMGLAMAFGLSYLFLDKNSLTLQSNTVPEYTIGEASNLVDQSFTGNIKLIAYYKLTKSLSFDVMPSFQYQIIAFKADVGSFKPYFLTLKAGLSYKFN